MELSDKEGTLLFVKNCNSLKLDQHLQILPSECVRKSQYSVFIAICT